MKNPKTLFLAQSGLIAAVYAAVTVVVAFVVPGPFMYGNIQFRVSEALCILPLFTPAAAPGLFVGCVISNAAGAAMGQTFAVDIIIGSLATLSAAVLTRLTRNITFKGVPLLPLAFPILVNAVIIGAEITYFDSLPFIQSSAWVGLGQLAVCYGLGIPFYYFIKKIGPEKIFK